MSSQINKGGKEEDILGKWYDHTGQWNEVVYGTEARVFDAFVRLEPQPEVSVGGRNFWREVMTTDHIYQIRVSELPVPDLQSVIFTSVRLLQRKLIAKLYFYEGTKRCCNSTIMIMIHVTLDRCEKYSWTLMQVNWNEKGAHLNHIKMNEFT